MTLPLGAVYPGGYGLAAGLVPEVSLSAMTITTSIPAHECRCISYAREHNPASGCTTPSTTAASLSVTIKSVPVLLREVSVQAPDKLLQRFLHRGIGRIYHEFVGQLGMAKFLFESLQD